MSEVPVTAGRCCTGCGGGWLAGTCWLLTTWTVQPIHAGVVGLWPDTGTLSVLRGVWARLQMMLGGGVYGDVPLSIGPQRSAVLGLR